MVANIFHSSLGYSPGRQKMPGLCCQGIRWISRFYQPPGQSTVQPKPKITGILEQISGILELITGIRTGILELIKGP